MKAYVLCALLAFSLLLTGCSGGEQRADFERFSKELSEKDSLSFTSDLRCEYEDKTLNFTLEFSGDKEGCSVTVLSPEDISGIRANLKPGGTELQYEDMILDTGELDEYGLSPMSALPCMVKALSGGHPESFWKEGSVSVCELSSPDGCTVRAGFSEDMCPLWAEIISGGRLRVFCEIAGWQ